MLNILHGHGHGRLKGTVWPDQVSRRVVPLDMPRLEHTSLLIVNFYLILNFSMNFIVLSISKYSGLAGRQVLYLCHQNSNQG
jgi:hypothetical protein